MMNKEIIIFLNSQDEDQAINLLENIPYKHKYSFIFSYLPQNEINELPKTTNMKTYQINHNTLFKPQSIYYLNEYNLKLHDLIKTLQDFPDINLYLIVTSYIGLKDIGITKTDKTTIIIEDSVYHNNIIDFPIDHCLTLNKIPDFFSDGNNINNVVETLQDKYQFTFEEKRELNYLLRKVNHENHLLKKIIENINQVILLTDKNINITYVNQYFTKLTGYDYQKIKGKNIRDLFNNEILNNCYEDILTETRHGQNYLLLLTDNDIYLELNFIPIMENNNLTDILIIIKDVTEIENIKNKDSITGVWNRIYFTKKLESIQNEKDNIIISLIDLSNFKEINDTLGHDMGDLILKEFAKKINGVLRTENYFSRFYLDKFIFMITESNCKDEIIDEVQKIIKVINEPFTIRAQTIYLSAHIGLAIYPYDASDVHNLLSHGEIALYTAKKKNLPYLFYNDEMKTPIIKKINFENSIHRAITNHEFTFYYQPIINIHNGKLTAIETLLRWHSKDKGVILPKCFLDYIEKTGQITVIGEYTMKEAMYKFPCVLKKTTNPPLISFNLSPKQLQDANLIENLTQIIEETNINPQNIMFEITENVTTESIQNTTNIFQYLSSLGISFSMDDFGTGYSSLGQLKNYPLKKIKIDKVLVHKMEQDTDYQAILKGIIALAHSMNYKVVAEGVETKEQLELLRRYNCDEVQGYYICKPIPFDELIMILKENKGNFSHLIN